MPRPILDPSCSWPGRPGPPPNADACPAILRAVFYRPFAVPLLLVLLLVLAVLVVTARDHPGVIGLINPIVRGWVNYFRIGHASRCFAYVRDWVEKKVRRHLMRARNRRGFGWKRWSRVWLYEVLGLFAEYRVQHLGRV
jgi:Group II intron, maturase-specific domain